jgi:hypothetical protein
MSFAIYVFLVYFMFEHIIIYLSKKSSNHLKLIHMISKFPKKNPVQTPMDTCPHFTMQLGICS